MFLLMMGIMMSISVWIASYSVTMRVGEQS